MKKEASIKPGKKAAVKRALIDVSVIKPKIIKTIEGGIIVPREPDAQIVPIARFWLYPKRNICGRAINPNSTTSPPIIPDIAAMITAIIDVTIAIPPRTLDNQTFNEAYMLNKSQEPLEKTE